MENKTLRDVYLSTDKELADFMREAIKGFFEMDCESQQLGVTASQKLKDSFILIAMTKTDD